MVLPTGPGKGESQERIEFRLLAGSDVVEMSVEQSCRRWALVHETCATLTFLGGAGRWLHRQQAGAIATGLWLWAEPGELHVVDPTDAPVSFRSWMMYSPFLAVHRHPIAPTSAFPNSLPELLHSCFDAKTAGIAAPGQPPCRAASGAARAAVGMHRPVPDYVRRAHDLIHLAYKREAAGKVVDIGRIAMALGMPPAKLVKSFKRSYGVPPYQYFVRLRLARAQHLICRGPDSDHRTLADVARLAGFHDLSQMDRSFVRLLGLSPRLYASQVGIYESWIARRSETALTSLDNWTYE